MQDHLGLVFLSFFRIQLPNRRVAFELIAFIVQKSLATTCNRRDSTRSQTRMNEVHSLDSGSKINISNKLHFIQYTLKFTEPIMTFNNDQLMGEMAKFSI